jgi:glutathione S-transferase
VLQLYFAPLTRSIRIAWLLEELGVAHEILLRRFDPKAHGAGQDTPSGRSSVLCDGGMMLSESGAIVQYVLENSGNGRLEPAIGSPERAAYLQWFHYAEGSAAPPINRIVGLTVYGNNADKYGDVVAFARQSADRMLDMLERTIAGHSFLVANAFSAADIMMGFTLWSARMLKILGPRHPETPRYVGEMKARPALAKAFAIGRT